MRKQVTLQATRHGATNGSNIPKTCTLMQYIIMRHFITCQYFRKV